MKQFWAYIGEGMAWVLLAFSVVICTGAISASRCEDMCKGKVESYFFGKCDCDVEPKNETK